MLLPLFGFAFIIGAIFYSDKIGETFIRDSNVNNAYDAFFIKWGTYYGVNWRVLKRIAYIEPRIGLDRRVKLGIENPKDISGSKSGDGLSWGIMQTTLSTAKTYDKTTTEEKLNSPSFSIQMGAAHLAFLKKNYPTFTDRDLVMSYNHGQGNQLKFIAKEKAGTLLLTEYPAGRSYWNHYLEAKELIP